MIGNLANELYLSPNFGDLAPASPAKIPASFVNCADAVARHRQNLITDAELVAVHWMAAHHFENPLRWLAQKPQQTCSGALDFVIHARFVKTKPLAHLALREWSAGRMQGVVAAGYVSIPDQLRAQSQGQRFVGISRDPEFIEHDLCHLAKFYWDLDQEYDARFHRRQVGFFKLMHHHAERWIAKDWLSPDEGLQRSRPLDRCASDMNGDGCFLFAALLAALLRAESCTSEDREQRPKRVISELWGDFTDAQQLSRLAATYLSDFNLFMSQIMTLLESI